MNLFDKLMKRQRQSGKKTCATCGEKHPDHVRFCPTCGTEFKETIEHYDCFISYRRVHGSHVATVVKLELEKFGKKAFLDVDEMQTGRFDEQLLYRIENTPNFLIVLSEDCLERCKNKSDWLKREIVHALQTNRNIIPIIVQSFSFPDERLLALLPEVMRDLPNYQAVHYNHADRIGMTRKILGYMKRTRDVKPRHKRVPVSGRVIHPEESHTADTSPFQPEHRKTRAQRPSRDDRQTVDVPHQKKRADMEGCNGSSIGDDEADSEATTRRQSGRPAYSTQSAHSRQQPARRKMVPTEKSDPESIPRLHDAVMESTVAIEPAGDRGSDTSESIANNARAQETHTDENREDRPLPRIADATIVNTKRVENSNHTTPDHKCGNDTGDQPSTPQSPCLGDAHIDITKHGS